jgi:hypothetical protein
LEVVAGAGHLLPVEAPDEVAAAIDRSQGQPALARSVPAESGATCAPAT